MSVNLSLQIDETVTNKLNDLAEIEEGIDALDQGEEIGHKKSNCICSSAFNFLE